MPGLLMRGLRFYVDHDHGTGPDFPALRLFAEVMLDAVNLVRGERHANATLRPIPSLADSGFLIFSRRVGSSSP